MIKNQSISTQSERSNQVNQYQINVNILTLMLQHSHFLLLQTLSYQLLLQQLSSIQESTYNLFIEQVQQKLNLILPKAPEIKTNTLNEQQIITPFIMRLCKQTLPYKSKLSCIPNLIKSIQEMYDQQKKCQKFDAIEIYQFYCNHLKIIYLKLKKQIQEQVSKLKAVKQDLQSQIKAKDKQNSFSNILKQHIDLLYYDLQIDQVQISSQYLSDIDPSDNAYFIYKKQIKKNKKFAGQIKSYANQYKLYKIKQKTRMALKSSKQNIKTRQLAKLQKFPVQPSRFNSKIKSVLEKDKIQLKKQQIIFPLLKSKSTSLSQMSTLDKNQSKKKFILAIKTTKMNYKFKNIFQENKMTPIRLKL